MSKIISPDISLKCNYDPRNNCQDDLKTSIDSIKTPLSGSNSSILEYISLQSSNVMTPPSPISSENSFSNLDTHVNSRSDCSNNVVVSRSSDKSASRNRGTNIGSSNSKNSKYSDNKKPIIFNPILENIKVLDATESNTSENVLSEDIELTKDLFYYIDGQPSHPPNYDDINPVRNIRLPIYENTMPVDKNEKPPEYTPTINKIIIVSFKLERVSPYEPSTSRLWKDYIMEINSTQLNFYLINDTIADKIKTLRNNKSDRFLNNHANTNNKDSYILSPKIKKSSAFLSKLSKESYTFDLNENEQEKICSYIYENRSKYLLPSNIFKTYSLQYAKYGIPIDYHKKPFVLRLRCESEQFLINFNNIDDMIMWSVYLSIGISVSLDLEVRELPNYRVVPRRRRRHRRRRHRRHHHGFSHIHNRIHFEGLNHVKVNVALSRNFEVSANSSIPKKSRSYSLSSVRVGLSLNNTNYNNNHNLHMSNNITTLFEENITNFTESHNNTQVIEKSASPNSHLTRTSDTFISHNTSPSINSTYDLNKFKNNTSTSTINASFVSKMRNIFKMKKSFSELNDSKTIKHISSTNLSNDSSMNNKKYTRVRAMSTPSISNTPKSHNSADNKNSINKKCDHKIPDSRICERKITENLIQEIHTHHRMHSGRNRTENTFDNYEDNNELDEFDNIDSNLTDEDEDEDDIDNSNNDMIVFNNNEGNVSIYAEEGYFDDEDEDEEEEIMDNSISSPIINNSRTHLNQLPMSIEECVYNEDDDRKWQPNKKEMSRKRYIRDSLRCIKPFVEDQEWIGHVVFRPIKEPSFKTNNPPIWTGNNDNRKKFRYLSSSDYSNVKNHYLKPYIVGPIGFLKAETKIVSQFHPQN